ncbi:unnamed protein product [Paramecium primaurelia]|uniref:Uncharacterized protein n=1 Tax=Paramecium primaurelia TaxID=5886 RepID=A0A8S1JMT3_PARPR|nr:unnamed protein product [Paramecium primaurelia]
MNTQDRCYIRAIVRKTKKTIQNNIKSVLDEDNYGLTDFENNAEEFQSLSEEFSGKCILQNYVICELDTPSHKKNKEVNNQIYLFNDFIQQETVPSEIKIIKKQQNQQNEDNQDSETLSDSSQCYDLNNELHLIAQQGEIDYLEGLKGFKKTVETKQKYQNRSKKIQNKIIKQHQILQIQQKKIIKNI